MKTDFRGVSIFREQLATTRRLVTPVEATTFLFDDWFDPIEAGRRKRVRDFIETIMRSELDDALVMGAICDQTHGIMMVAKTFIEGKVKGHRYAPADPAFDIAFDCLHDSTTRRGSTRTASLFHIERE